MHKLGKFYEAMRFAVRFAEYVKVLRGIRKRQRIMTVDKIGKFKIYGAEYGGQYGEEKNG